MKTTRTLRVLLILLSLAMILPLFAACNKKEGQQEPASTETATTPPTPSPFDPPVIELDEDASIYSGTPDTSWFTGTQTEYTLTSADQLVGFQELRSQNNSFEGVTIKLGCDMILNKGTTEEVKERGSDNHAWKDLNSNHFFRGNFDGQGHSVSGLYMQLTESAVSSMFGGVAGNVTIKNFNLINSYFGAPTTGENKAILAGLVAKITEDGSDVTIQGVNLNLSIEETNREFDKVAGYVGYVSGKVNLNINNSTCAGNISVTGTHAGGFVAHIDSVSAKVRITTCTNFADITTKQYCGGIIGQSKAQDMKVIDCINRGDLNCKLNCKNLTGEHIVLHDIHEGAHPEIAEGTSAIRVMSFNVQGTLPKTDGVLTQASLNRIEAVKQEILYYTPDLLGLQEDNLTWLMNLKLDDYNIIQDSVNGSSSGTERCAIYYKKGMKLLDSGTHWLTHTGTSNSVALTYAEITDPNSKFYMTPEELNHLMITCDADLKSSRKRHWDETTGEFVDGTTSYTCTTTRKFTYGVFDVNGQIIIYVNTHLTHRSQNADYSNDELQKIRSNARIKEWDILMGHLEEIEKQYPDSLVFFTGDFNDNKNKPIYNYVTQDFGYSSAESITAEHIGPTGSWNSAFNLDKQGDNYSSSSQSNEGTSKDYLDYCFVENGLTVNRFIVGAGKSEITLANGSKKTIYTSDHLPVITDLSFKTATTGTHIVPDSSTPSIDLTKPSVYKGLPDISWYTGDQTEYTLYTAEQFVGMLTLRQESKGAITFDGVTIKLARDLIFNQGTVEEYLKSGLKYEIQALNSNYQFKGTFDGQGHTISGLYIKCTTSAVRGLFGGIGDNAVIKDLTLINCYSGGPTDPKKEALGILSGRIIGQNVTFSNVKIDCVMTEGTQIFSAIGALTGRVDKGASITIENCEVSGSINFGTYGTNCGSLIGLVQEGATATIKNCKSDMDITGTNYCGGLVGYDANNGVTVDSQSSYTGTITCPQTQGELIGNK